MRLVCVDAWKKFQESKLADADSPQQLGEILFVCKDDAGLNQMAKAYAEEYGMEASSAECYAQSSLNPLVVQAMKERNIDISDQKPRILTPEIINRASVVVTIGCHVEDMCPLSLRAELSRKNIQWDWCGIRHKSIEGIRKNRVEIERRVDELYCSKGLAISPLGKTVPMMTL